MLYFGDVLQLDCLNMVISDFFLSLRFDNFDTFFSQNSFERVTLDLSLLPMVKIHGKKKH